MEKGDLNQLKKFLWEPCPAGQAVVDRLLAAFLEACPPAAKLARDMRERSGTRFADWVDFIAVRPQAPLAAELEAAGFVERRLAGDEVCFAHPGAVFPKILLSASGAPARVALKVEAVADFLATHGISNPIAGIPMGRLRTASAWSHGDSELVVVERHGSPAFEVPETKDREAIAACRHAERFRSRRRAFGDEDAAFSSLQGLLNAAVDELGEAWTADLWFASERDYWMRRNRAARAQKARQDALGLGWANHDHHTYRCRRETFHRVIAVFESLGCTCRERFYAGAEAGWGAQVLEHEAAGVVIFADVDMAPEELAGDFAHGSFLEGEDNASRKLGTVGLWCELHGESILEAGMHHLECQFDFDGLREQLLAEDGISMMPPFTDFSYLRQQFTEGERWIVRPERVQKLLDSGRITAEEARRFAREGAIGSHLENLERNDGFKGFNQTGVSDIIARTDPRSQLTSSA